MPKFLTQYSPQQRYIASSDLPSLTDETFRDECDISLMIERCRVSRVPLPTVDISYGDSPTVEELERAQYLLADVKTNFERLPSDVRDSFGNDVSNYLKYIGDKNNLKDCYERGLIDRNSVSIEDVYPERFQHQTELQQPPSDLSVDKQPVVDKPVDASVNANS